MQLVLLQILVVVAIIQVRILKAEVEKGSMRTAFDHGLVGPKGQINFVNSGTCPTSFRADNKGVWQSKREAIQNYCDVQNLIKTIIWRQTFTL